MSNEPVKSSGTSKVVVATTVALSFISFWRGAAIVLSDLASSMFYAGGVTEQAVGKAAPWFVLGVMFFGFAIRSVYLESCSMFVRGGVYVVVRDAMGPLLAKFSVSALIFDFLLTGPISAVSAGHYIAGLFNEISEMLHWGYELKLRPFAVFFAVLATLYFWRANIKGIHESSGKALRIIQITTVMIVALLIWCPITLLLQPHVSLPPLPTLENLRFTDESLGWFKGTLWAQFAAGATFIAIGHAFLSMSGFETLAQVYREIAYPKMKNLRIASLIICVYAIIGTGVITMLAVMIIPDELRSHYVHNLIGGLAMNLAGPMVLKICFHAFVVVVGALILSGAVNTSMIGANGILNRVAEDGVIVDAFRKPHPHYGTTYRLINIVAVLQLATILLSGGDVYILGEAYAFGVVWSFCLKSLGVTVLRFQRTDQEYRTPLNLKIGKRELPIGLMLITSTLFIIAVTNLFSKQVATMYGAGFTVALFYLFTISERINARKHKATGHALEQFVLEQQPELGVGAFHPRPGCMLVAVRDFRSLAHFSWVLENTNIDVREIVVVTVRRISHGEGEYALKTEQYFAKSERELFSHVVEMAEKAGKTVSLLVVPASAPLRALVHTAATLKARTLVLGTSARMDVNELARRIGLYWEDLPEPRHSFSLAVINKERRPLYISLGPHPPKLWPDDVEKLHDIWLMLTEKEGLGANLHHRDVVSFALQKLEQELNSGHHKKIMSEIEEAFPKVKHHIHKDK